MKEFKIQTTEFTEITIDRSAVFNEIFICNYNECIRFPVHKIDELINILQEIKQTKG